MIFGTDTPSAIANLVPMLVFVVIFVFWGVMVRDFFENPEIPQNQRIIWILAFLVFSFPTALYYYFTRFRNRN